MDGVNLRFHLAGINNQNFLMRDEQTGTYWQQITGLAVAGPLAGKRLVLVPADELSFSLWKNEQPEGTVLDDAAGYAKEYAPPNWDVRMDKVPTTLSYAQPNLKPRDLMLGIHAFGVSRAFPYQAVLKEGLLQDHIGSEPVLLVTGPDARSVRVFRRRLPANASTGREAAPPNRGGSADLGADRESVVLRGSPDEAPADFYRLTGAAGNGLFMDASTGTQWNFQGCGVSGKLKGVCLESVNTIKDYWFDWRHYNPDTTVYGIKQKIR